MKTLRPLILLPFLLLSTACVAPVILGAAAAVGIWTYDDKSQDRGEMILRSTAQEGFDTAIESVSNRPAATDIVAVDGAMRLEFIEDNAAVVVQIMLMPKTPEFCTLRVYTSELGLRNRGELARDIAEDINKRIP